MLFDVCHLKIRIKHIDAMMDCFRVMLKLSTQIADPVDEKLACVDIECLRVVALTKGLALDKSIQDVVHRHLCLETLIMCAHTDDEVIADVLPKILEAAGTVSLRKCSPIVKGTASCAIAVVGVA